MFLDIGPRALPWAIASCRVAAPVGPNGNARARHYRRNAATGESPGQRPGYASTFQQALKGRHNRCSALSGLGMFLNIEPRALPWAIAFCPFGAAEGGGE